MIFVTVGSQLPFERLICAMDDWAANHKDIPVVAQIGTTRYEPHSLKATRFLSASEFDAHIKTADIVVSHAGMGTILAALKHSRPLLLMPRLATLGEHRNEHQSATIKHLADRLGLTAVHSIEELETKLNHRESISIPVAASNDASVELTDFLAGILRQ